VCNLVFNDGETCAILRWEPDELRQPGDWHCTAMGRSSGLESRGAEHILGEEACRALALLNVRDAAVQAALRNATAEMNEVLAKAEALGHWTGYCCCKRCTVALWRNLSAGGLDDAERRLANGMRILKSFRDGTGRWKVFPFHYTLLTLDGIALPEAADELRYAAPVCEQYLKRPGRNDAYASRRRAIAERILGKH